MNPFFKTRIMSPGPTPVPDFVNSAMIEGLHNHRGPAFADIMKECRQLLPKLFQTKEEVLIFAGTGTLAMEGAVVNFFEPGEKILSVNSGKFGQRWGDQAKAYGLSVDEILVERGSSVDIVEVENRLNQSEYAGVMVHASETSTSVRHDIKAIADLVSKKSNTLMLVDAVTAIGSFSIPTDEWGLDVVVAGSQKGFMLPPGLSFASVSKKAWSKSENLKTSRYYMDWRKELKSIHKNTGAFTSAVTLVAGLLRALKHMDSIGFENMYKRTWKLAMSARRAVEAMGLDLLVKNDADASGSCTAVMVDGAISNKDLLSQYSLQLAGGQDELKGKIVRIGHIGYMDAWDVLNQIIAIGDACRKAGKQVELLKGIDVFLQQVQSPEDVSPY